MGEAGNRMTWIWRVEYQVDFDYDGDNDGFEPQSPTISLLRSYVLCLIASLMISVY